MDNSNQIIIDINNLNSKLIKSSKLLSNLSIDELNKFNDPYISYSFEELFSLKQICDINSIKSINKPVFYDMKDKYIKDLSIEPPNYNELESEFNSLSIQLSNFTKNFGNISYNDSCSCCIKNKNIINNLYNIDFVKNRINSLQSIISKKHETLQIISTAKKNLKIINDFDYFYKQNNILSSNLHIDKIINIKKDLAQLKNNEYLEQLKILKHKLHLHNQYLSDYEQNSNFTHNQNIQSLINKANDDELIYNTAVSELNDLNNFNRWNLLNSLKSKFKTLKDINIQNMVKRFIILKNKKTELDHFIYKNKQLSSLNNLLYLSNYKTQYNITTTKLNHTINLKQKAIYDKHNSFDLLKTTQNEYNSLQSQYNNYTSLKNDIATNNDELNLLSLYYSCLDPNSGIPYLVIKNSCKYIMHQCNKFLQQISDFLIDISFDKSLTFLICNNNDNFKLPASMGSGFQKFIIDMVLRIILNKISYISNPNILFIDEGFGCLDKLNFINIANLLHKFKSHFDTLFLITHLDELKSYGDIVLHITHTNVSSLQYGNLTSYEKSILTAIELKEDSDYLKEEKRKLKGKYLQQEQDKRQFKHKNRQLKLQQIQDKRKFNIKYNINNINNYINSHGGLTSILIQTNNNKTFTCLACNKNFVIRSNAINNHVNSMKSKSKHHKYILYLINNNTDNDNNN